ncbi:MAG: exodeoxyribonuclease VII large subunit [Pseudomonadales bacterium]|nr:exodeoxyribonuclease VII large subunit [Pseudomonadales bacterium]
MSSAEHIFSVTELNRRARQLLETHLATVWVSGEISNLSTPSSGHWYFTLKDDKAQIRCAMFRGQNALLRFKPEHGMQVLARGRVGLYEGRGDYQLVVENLQADGAGNLQLAFEQLKNKLAAEGLFDEDFKQPLPDMPRHVGIITSPTGAAIRDIVSVFKRRFPAAQLSIFPVPVQGAEAAPAIVKALQLANTQRDIDVLILARGGGSLEDLWAFNEESVARAVFASEIPTVSAVGHETDFTICDFVADVRAPTPSAAAEMLSPEIDDLLALLAHYADLFHKQFQQKITRHRQQLLYLAKRLRHPGHVLREQQQKLDHLEWRLLQAPVLHLQKPQQKLARLAASLNNLSPLNTLQRGYAIVTSDTSDTSTVLTQTDQVQLGMMVNVQLFQGRLRSRVESIDP